MLVFFQEFEVLKAEIYGSHARQDCSSNKNYEDHTCRVEEFQVNGKVFFLENVRSSSHKRYPNGCGTVYVLFHMCYAQTSTLFFDCRRVCFFSYSLKQFQSYNKVKMNWCRFPLLNKQSNQRLRKLCVASKLLCQTSDNTQFLHCISRNSVWKPPYRPGSDCLISVALKGFKRNLKPLAVYPTNPQMIKYNWWKIWRALYETRKIFKYY